MKKVLMILIICSSFSYAQTTGFLQDFNDGTMTGWATGHDNTFQLSVDSTFLRIDYSRNASSDLWDNFNLTLPHTIDVSNNPRLYVRAKSNVPVVIGLKPVPVNDVAIISQSILGDGKWKELFFEITNTTNQNISTIYAYLDAGTTEQKSGTVWFDEIRIGDSLLTLPANFTELEEAIKSANALLLNSAEGTGEGQFPSGSKSVLENEINSFLDLLKLDIPQSSVDSAITELYDVCSTFESNVISLPLNIVDEKANKQTKYLFLNLQENMERSILFGMHDVTGYGVGWSGDDDRSDVKSIVGDYPAIYSEDLNNITRNQQVDRIRYRLTSAYGRGGIITMCWHQYDPDGRSFYADDIGNEKIVSQILPGGNRHQDYLDKLKRIANFFKSLRGEKGEAIPVIFRPYHEHTGGWFWWGVGHCTTEEYNQIWKFTADYLHDSLNVHNLLWAISPTMDHIRTGNSYFNRFPGNDYVDIYGTDYYYNDPMPQNKVDEYISGLHTVAKLAMDNQKIPALTEVGQEGLDDEDWFTKMLLDPIKNDSLSTKFAYAAVWRNQDQTHHFAPYPGHPVVPDFIEFYNDPYSLFESDLPDMYSLPVEDVTAPEFISYPQEEFVSPSTLVEINILTDERAFLRWSDEDKDYDEMTNQFEFGERDYNHSTIISAEHGANTKIYIRATDIYGNKTEQSISISFSVDTLQAPIIWADIRYPLTAWKNNSASLGTGGDVSNSINMVNSAYFVKEFELTSLPNGARIAVQYVGGTAIFINGVEVVRYNLDEDSLSYESNGTSESKVTKSYTLSSDALDLLNTGINRIGIEVHAVSNGSVEFFDALFQTDQGIPFAYGADWFFFDDGKSPNVYTLGEITSVDFAQNGIPKEPKLYQNYPNPFNPTTTIKFSVPVSESLTSSDTRVDLRVFDLLGREIATIVNEELSSGIHIVEFDASELSSGIYYYRIIINENVSTKKMMLLK